MSGLDLYWTGSQSYMRALKASLMFSNRTEPRPPDSYTWVDRDGVAASYSSGEVGEVIRRDQWREELAGTTYLRELMFAMWPKNMDREGDINTAKEEARASGWSLWGSDALNNRDETITWRDFMIEFEDRPTLVQVPSSDKLFECDSYELDLIDAGGVMATFEAQSILFGAFLDSGYDINNLGRYRPCEYTYGAEAFCSVTNGEVFCDGKKLTLADIEGNSASPTPSPAMAGVTVDWQLEQSYMYGENVEAILKDAVDYCFKGESNIKLNSGSGGNRMDRTWSEECYNRNRRIYFKASRYPNNNGNGFLLDEGYMNNENGNTNLEWSQNYGSFEESFIILPDDSNYDAWTCDHVEFNFRREKNGEVVGRFVADNFILGMYLNKGYNAETLNLFNPCQQMDECQNQQCTCKTVDGQVSCDVPFSINTADTKVSEDGITKKSAAPVPGFFGRTSLIMIAMGAGVVLLF